MAEMCKEVQATETNFNDDAADTATTISDSATSTPDEAEQPASSVERTSRISRACSHCKRAKARCETKRPCMRCVRTGRASSCIDSIHQKRGRKQHREFGVLTTFPIATPLKPFSNVSQGQIILPAGFNSLQLSNITNPIQTQANTLNPDQAGTSTTVIQQPYTTLPLTAFPSHSHSGFQFTRPGAYLPNYTTIPNSSQLLGPLNVVLNPNMSLPAQINSINNSFRQQQQQQSQSQQHHSKIAPGTGYLTSTSQAQASNIIYSIPSDQLLKFSPLVATVSTAPNVSYTPSLSIGSIVTPTPHYGTAVSATTVTSNNSHNSSSHGSNT